MAGETRQKLYIAMMAREVVKTLPEGAALARRVLLEAKRLRFGEASRRRQS